MKTYFVCTRILPWKSSITVEIPISNIIPLDFSKMPGIGYMPIFESRDEAVKFAELQGWDTEGILELASV